MHLLERHLIQPDLLIDLLHLLFEHFQFLLFLFHLCHVPIEQLLVLCPIGALLLRQKFLSVISCLQTVIVILLDQVLLEVVDAEDVLE